MPKKAAPPPAPALPLFSIDGLVALFLRPVANPLFTLLPPLVVLSLDPDPHTSTFYYASLFSILSILFQLLSYINTRIAGGRRRHVDWEQEVVLIVGGAGGLGRALAEYYGSIQRCPTAVADILPATKQRCTEWEAVGCDYYHCDVSDSDAVESLRRQVEEYHGGVTVLIFAAGTTNSKTVLHLEPKDIKKAFNVNTLGAIWCIKQFLPRMLGQSRDEDGWYGSEGSINGSNSKHEDSARQLGGTIVNVSSVLGYLGAAGQADYTASKAALTVFHESLKAELAHMQQAARVNLILVTPGMLATPMFLHVPSPPLAWFLGPIVTPALLAAEIIRAVEEGRDKEISIPLYTQWIGLLKILPAALAKCVRAIVGLDASGLEGARVRETRQRAS